MNRKELIQAITDRDTASLAKLFEHWKVFYKEGDEYVDDAGHRLTEAQYRRYLSDPRNNAFVVVDIFDSGYADRKQITI